MPRGYTSTQIALHWIIAALFVFQLIFGEEIAHAYRDWMRTGEFESTAMVRAHVIAGLCVLALAVPRFLIKRRRGAPPLPENEAPWMKTAAHVTHFAFYALMLLLPVSGVLAWFGDQAWAGEAHELMKPVTVILIALHVGGALYQQFVLKSDVLARMKRPEA